MKKFNVVVIGGGPAGITSARYLKINKPELSVAVIRPEDNSMIYCAEPYAIEGLMSYEKTLKPDSKTTEFGAVLIRDLVVKVDFNNKKLELKSDEIISYDKLIIATGALPVKPRIKNIEMLKNVMTLKTGDELKTLIELKEHVDKVIVVGAGAIGIELSQAFMKLNKQVTLIDMQEHILSAMLDKDMAEIPEQELKNINLIFNSKITKLNGINGIIESVVLDNNKTILTDLVIFAIGAKPVLELFENTDLEIGKTGIKVNEKMQTNIPDVYAVGDCVEFYSFITKNIISGKLATNAVPMAKVACSNIIGEERFYQGYINGAVTKVGDLYVGGTGLTESDCINENIEYIVGYGATTARFPIMPDKGKIKIKLIFEKKSGRIIGGQIYGTMAVAERIDLITLGIQNDFTYEHYIKFSYCAQPYQTFFPAKNAIVEAAENVKQKYVNI